jgi:hypothetical protein
MGETSIIKSHRGEGKMINEYPSLVYGISSIPKMLRDTIKAIWICTFPDRFECSVDFSIMISGKIDMDILDIAELQAQGVSTSGWGRMDDFIFNLPISFNVLSEVKALNKSGLLTELISVEQYHSDNIEAIINYGYPHYLIHQSRYYGIVTQGDKLDINIWYPRKHIKKLEVLNLNDTDARLWIHTIMEWMARSKVMEVGNAKGNI